MIECPGCRFKHPDQHLDPPDRANASGECLQAYSDLQCYTVAKQDPEFIHQHAVDAYAAQHAGGQTRTITVAFGLIGLYLALEKGYTGKQVQRAHMKIAKIRKDWPRLDPPRLPAPLTVIDVVHAGTDSEQDAMIMKWMTVVWRVGRKGIRGSGRQPMICLTFPEQETPGNRAFERSYKRESYPGNRRAGRKFAFCSGYSMELLSLVRENGNAGNA